MVACLGFWGRLLATGLSRAEFLRSHVANRPLGAEGPGGCVGTKGANASRAIEDPRAVLSTNPFVFM